MRRLFVPGYYSGFSNNKMSLDIAIVLAYLTGRVLVPYRFRMPRRFPVDLPPDRVIEPMLVPDLFDIPVPYSDEYLFKTWISVPGALECKWEPVFESVFCFPATLPTDDARFRHFRNGRWYVHAFSQQQDEAPDLHIKTEALGHYSYFFYLDEERRREVVDLMKRLRPKRPYLAVADRIAASFGPFNAIHIRRGDFLSNELSRKKILRSTSVSGQEIVANLASRMRRDELLVICTDGSSREEIFGPIQQYFRETIFLDRYLRENTNIREMISQLPRDDEDVQALLTQLVASKARVFAGTFFSTFTALIHRLRGFTNHESSFLYCYNDFISPLVRFDRCEFLPVDDGPYSWNRIRYPLSPDAYSWMREWPESSNATPSSFEREEPPPGTLDLCAREAAVHGNTIRYMEEGGSQMIIGDWTDQNAFVTWDLMLPAGGTYAVEIQYGCPEESSGSRYGVGIEGADELRGQMWNTGSWTSLSPWLPLGRLRIPAGRSRLVVRAVENTSAAVMNLSGVRLVPAEIGSKISLHHDVLACCANHHTFTALPRVSHEDEAPPSETEYLQHFVTEAYTPHETPTPSAWTAHVPFFFGFLTLMKPQRFVELGTLHGNCFFAACQVARRMEATLECIAVDTWQGDAHTGSYNEDVFEQFSYILQRDYAGVGRYIRRTFDDASRQFEPGSIDLLHIDGLHTYEAVAHDFATWLPKMSACGIIMFHDIHVHGEDFGVWQLWNEVKHRYPSLEFEHGYGLGLLLVGHTPHPRMLQLMNLLSQPAYRTLAETFFSNLGILAPIHGRS